MHAGSCSPPLRAPMASGLRDPPRPATHFSFSRAPTGASSLPPPPESAGPSALKSRSLQPPPVGPSAGRTRAPAAALLNRRRHHGNGQPRLGRQAAGSKLRQQLAFRDRGAGGGPPREGAVVSVGRNTWQPSFSWVFFLNFVLF